MSATRQLRVGSRRSPLALAQTGQVAAALHGRSALPPILVPIVSDGDTRTGAPVAALGTTGVFVNALRHRLADGRIDVAVHSLKDVPTQPAPGLSVAAVPLRGDPRDALISRSGLSLRGLPRGARVGTGSVRRAAQIRALGLGLDVVPIRGNVDSRLRMVLDGTIDAVVVATAGVQRLGFGHLLTEIIDPETMLPAPAQGALAVECRSDDEHVLEILAGLDDAATRAAVDAERALMRTLEAGCSAPIGALATVEQHVLHLRAQLLSEDGSRAHADAVTGPATDASALGERLARVLVSTRGDVLAV